MSDIWNEPLSEGVQETNPPAETPSEVVGESSIETTAEESAAVENASAESEAGATIEKDEQGEQTPEQPELKREARRVFMEVQRLGGEEAVKEHVDLSATLLNQELPAVERIQKLYQSSPKAHQEIGAAYIQSNWEQPEWKEALLQRDFGEGATPEKILEWKAFYEQYGESAPLPEYTDDTPDMAEEERLSAATKAKLAKLDELEKKFPELETKVNKFNELQTQAEEQKVIALGNEFVQEALSPVVRMMREAGLEVTTEDSQEEKEWKEWAWDTTIRQVYQELMMGDANRPLADDIETFIKKLDRQAAWGKMRTAQARAEVEASKRLRFLTAQRQAQRDSATSVLTKTRPPQITGGSPSFGSTAQLPTGRDAWNSDGEAERWKDIAAT